jgi:hypothetical protein
LPLLALAFAITLIFAATAFADEFPMTPEAAQEALAEGERVESQLTDPKAAEQLPHRDLERAQALQLLSAVFGTQIEGVAGVFNDLDVDHFLSDNAAVIDAGDQPEASGVVIGDGDYAGPALLESTVPLRTEDQSGKEATVDLGLEHAEGEIQPADPLVEVGIPSELGEGIELTQSKVGITLAGAPQERAPSIVDQTVAVFPEVAEDTSFAVAPSPTGVETFTLLQSADAPESSTYQLSLPEGASLTATDDGGAEVSTGDEPLLRIFPPAALDAEGNGVPVTLTVSGDSFAVHAEPQEGAAYPILVDPVVESYQWWGTSGYTNMSDWVATSSNQGLLPDIHSALWNPGIDLRAVKGFSLPYNAKAHWAYSVPRYASDEKEFGKPPTSYIAKMVTTNVFFIAGADTFPDPIMAAGIWNNSKNNWATAWAHAGNTGNLENMATTYTFSTAEQDAKQAIGNEMWAGQAHTMGADRESYVGSATVELADALAPNIGSFAPPEKWVNETANAPGIPFAATDTGLGVVEMLTEDPSDNKTRKGVNLTCIGIVTSPCPRTWSENGTTSWLHIYEPSKLTQGIHKMKAYAKDPVGNKSAPYEFTLKVDHTAPEINLSGSMTTSKFEKPEPQYVLVAKSSDGTEAAPQSGIASTEISFDGKAVNSTSSGCATQNCAVTREWVLNSASYSPGAHTVVVKATDGVGLVTTKTIKVNLVADTVAPAITSMTGGLENAPSGWVEQKSYSLNASATDAGYGVTSIEFLMDGKVASKKTQSCPAGACTGTLTTTLNMAAYKGGAHVAEYVVKDGVGNTTKKAWTVNVDPSGAISTAETIDTIEAVEKTTEATPIAPTDELIDPAERAYGNDPGLEVVEGGFQSNGTPLDSFIPSEPSKGVTLEASGGSIKVTEVGAAGGSPPSIASEVASVDPNTATQVDSVVRPIYDGDQGFKVIRDVTAPTKYSWKLLLNAGQKLEQVDSKHVAVFWGNGERALLISAEQAHDATGKEVPTELTAEGSDVITLTVKHTSVSFVYPVLAGPTFESGYTLPVIWEPPAKTDEYWESGETIVGPPEPIPSGEASASMAGGSRKEYLRVICGHTEFFDGGYNFKCGNPFKKEKGSQTPWQAGLRGAFLYKPGQEVEQRGAIACAGMGWDTSVTSVYWVEPAYQCHYGPKTSDGNGGATATAGHYLRAQAHWKLGHRAKCGGEACPGENPAIWEDRALELHLWPSGIVDETFPN